MNKEIHFHAKKLWDYHKLNMEVPLKADLLLVGGSHDTRVAERAGNLALSGDYKWIVVSGGSGKITKDTFTEPEAVVFAKVMIELGVPESRILLEEKARFTGENITLSHALLKAIGASIDTGLLVSKPYLERRFITTARKQWPEVMWSVTSPEIEFEENATDDATETRMIELLVGDLQRIDVYAKRGIQIEQVIPEDVVESFDYLVKAGFDAQLINT